MSRQHTVLVCTVGGSPEPIVTAIRETRADFVVYVCSEDDPSTGRRGSYTQVTGEGAVCKRRLGDDRPTLPNIPTQADHHDCDVELVPADDLDEVHARITRRIAVLREKDPHARVIADYTGGTKTMTAGLVLAALQQPAIEVRLVTSRRENLEGVTGGQRSVAASVEAIRLGWAMLSALESWRRYEYGAAAAELARIPAPSAQRLRGPLQRALDLSEAFDAWDRFDHEGAWRLLPSYSAMVGARWSSHLASLRALTSSGSAGDAARLMDLWRNAQRRGALGRFDDAVARVYRLWEATAQWLLAERRGIDTARVATDAIPAGLSLAGPREGRHQLGLRDSWELLAALEPSTPAGRLFSSERKRILHLLAVRNTSLLAHGFTPVRESQWREIAGWTEARFLPCLLEELAASGIRAMLPQLPSEFPMDLLPPRSA